MILSSFHTEFNYKTVFSAILIIAVIAVLTFFVEKNKGKNEQNNNYNDVY